MLVETGTFHFGLTELPCLSITNLNIFVDNTQLLYNINLALEHGTVHALVGPNGAGKSTLASAIIGHPNYVVQSGSLIFQNSSILGQPTYARARAGIFLAMQTPPHITGLTTYVLLKEAVRSRDTNNFSLESYTEQLEQVCREININSTWLYRTLDSGFSGGEKKRLELLALLMLKPTLIILDEIDSGLDSESTIIFARIIKTYLKNNPQSCLLCISHHKHFQEAFNPNYVHTMDSGHLSSRTNRVY